jgi:hypothetical protein
MCNVLSKVDYDILLYSSILPHKSIVLISEATKRVKGFEAKEW